MGTFLNYLIFFVLLLVIKGYIKNKKLLYTNRGLLSWIMTSACITKAS